MSWDHVRAMCCLPEQRGLLYSFSKHFHLTQSHHQSLSASFYALLTAALAPSRAPCRLRACRRCCGYDPNPARDERCGACHTGVDCSGHLLDTFSSLTCTTNRSSRASRPRSSLRSASRAPRRPRAGLPRFGDTSDVLSRQPLRDGRVDRCWCQ